jgi:hypothetical protein
MNSPAIKNPFAPEDLEESIWIIESRSRLTGSTNRGTHAMRFDECAEICDSSNKKFPEIMHTPARKQSS